MAHYLVTARPKRNLVELEQLLKKNALLELKPFGKEISRALSDARTGSA